jgi:hypothetical protein
MKCLLLDSNGKRIRKIEISIPQSISVEDFIESVKAQTGFIGNLYVSKQGAKLESGLITDHEKVSIHLDSVDSNDDAANPGDTTSKKAKVSESTQPEVSLSNLNIIRSIQFLLCKVCVSYKTYMKKDRDSLRFMKVISRERKSAMEILKNTTKSNEESKICCKFLKKMIELLDKNIAKAKRCMKIMNLIADLEVSSPVNIWIDHAIRLMKKMLKKNEFSSSFADLRVFIKLALIKPQPSFIPIKALNDDIKLFISSNLQLTKVAEYFNIFSKNYCKKADKMLKISYQTEIGSIVSSTTSKNALILHNCNQQGLNEVQNNDSSKVAVFLIFLHELSHVLINSSGNATNVKCFELSVFGCFFRSIDDKIADDIIQYLSGSVPTIDINLYTGYNLHPNSCVIKPRNCEFEAELECRSLWKSEIKKKRPTTNFNPDYLAKIETCFSKQRKIEIIIANIDTFFIPTLHYLCKSTSYITIFESLLLQVSNEILRQISSENLLQENPLQIRTKDNFNFSFAIAKSMKNLISEVAKNHENFAKKENLINFSSVWSCLKQCKLTRISQFIENLSLPYALRMYHYELFTKILEKFEDKIIAYFLKHYRGKVNMTVKSLSSLGLAKAFSDIMKHEAIKGAYHELKNFQDYDKAVDEAVLKTYTFEFPESNYGKTLTSSEIVIGNFMNYNSNDEMLKGGFLYVFIHEFANFLQRFHLQTCLEYYDYDTPEKNKIDKEKDSGDKIERSLFNRPENLYLNGARFLFNLPIIQNSTDFCQQFVHENKVNDVFLHLRRKTSEGVFLELGGVCGMKLQKEAKEARRKRENMLDFK